MSFFANLFNLGGSSTAESTSPSRSQRGGSGATLQPTYSFAKLQQLYDRLSRFRESDLEKSGEGDALIETVRQITEALIWGEQNNSQFFDFFCEKNIFSDLVRVLGLRRAPKKVKLQLLQTLSMLIQNIRQQTSVYYILSNNHVNRLMSTQMDFEDEEVLAYYITLMKSLAMRLDGETIKFFFIQHPEPTFPLYIEATKFFGHKDHMVRAAVRTITLQVYRIEDHPMRRFVLRHAAESYFGQLAQHLRELWLRLDAAVASAASEDDMSAVQRENELQQDLQIYLSDVFELGIAELNEMLADRLLNGALLPVLLAGVAGASGSRLSPVADGSARALAPHVAVFLIRQVFDTFHSPVLLEPLAKGVLWPAVPAALAYALPFQEAGGTSPASSDGWNSVLSRDGDFVSNPLRNSFLMTLQSRDDRTFLMAAAVVHSCLTKKIFTQNFIETAQLLPSQISSSPSSYPASSAGGHHARSLRSTEKEPLALLLEAIGQRSSYEAEPFRAFVRILLEVVYAEHTRPKLHAPAWKAAVAATRAAAYHVREVLRDAMDSEDGGAWLVDTFCEEWELHQAPLPFLAEFFADPRRLAPAAGGSGGARGSRRPSMQKSSVAKDAQKSVRTLLLMRRLMHSLMGETAGQDGSGTLDWSQRSKERLPLQLADEEKSRPQEGKVINLASSTHIPCNLASIQGQRSRELVLHSAWLLLAKAESTDPGSAEVTTVWPIWQVQSLIDRSDPRTLQIGMNAHKNGMPPGEAVAYNPPVSSYFTLTLNFDDVKKCNEAAVHLQSGRRTVRGKMLQKAVTFVDACCSPDSGKTQI
eukprot:TRINITY_DN36797_c0_g1_i1.p1 TRINITY_DN36797_c0_g1~~TRINITY_DN36797_c0_g1_i1.p1  ORF type:complete len:814 (+),score=157.76 TRINITY_DN36797_c0_g1_i1:79-2520(+)